MSDNEVYVFQCCMHSQIVEQILMHLEVYDFKIVAILTGTAFIWESAVLNLFWKVTQIMNVLLQR